VFKFRHLIIYTMLVLVACSTGNRKAEWIEDALTSVREGKYPRIVAISYWHEDWENSDGSISDLRLDSSPEALEAYKEGVGDDFFVTEVALSEDSLKVLSPSSGVYHCAFPDFGNTEDSVSLQLIDDFEGLVDKRLAWVTFSDNWVNGINFPEDNVLTVVEAGCLPYIRMMAFSVYEYDEGGVDSIYTMQNIIDGKFDDDLRKWAQDARGAGIPMMVCFGVEVNGFWFPWNGKWNGGAEEGPKRFKEAYKYIVDLFRAQGADNVTWVFHVNAGSYPDESWNSMAAYYPGDEYIDWIGISVYGPLTHKEARSYWETFTEIMDAYYPELCAISAEKPLAVLEFGVVE